MVHRASIDPTFHKVDERSLGEVLYIGEHHDQYPRDRLLEAQRKDR